MDTINNAENILKCFFWNENVCILPAVKAVQETVRKKLCRVGIPTSNMSPQSTAFYPECTGGNPQSIFRLANHTSYDISPLKALSHTPLTVLQPVRL